MECGLSAGRPGPILKRDVVRGCGPHTRRILDTAKPKNDCVCETHTPAEWKQKIRPDISLYLYYSSFGL